jgi:hypothetical protein
LEAIVNRALAKNPTDRFADGNEFRHELHATAHELGLEHADTVQTPSMEALRNAGSESPSGRLVIDLATLRQVQASSEEKPASEVWEGKRPEFDRVNVSFEQPDKLRARRRLVLAVMILFIGFVAIAAVASRWWSLSPQTQIVSTAVPSASPSPSPNRRRPHRRHRLPQREPNQKPPKKKQSRFGSFVIRSSGSFIGEQGHPGRNRKHPQMTQISQIRTIS